MAVINLRNVVALGVLEDGVYPSVYNGQTGEYIGTVDGEGAGVKTVPTLYMYYRKNGHLYLYRTKERIEIDLTNVTAYDNSALFKLTEKSDISSAKITEFESRNINVGHYEYKVPWVKSTQQYLYILVPIVRSIHTITVQGIISNQIFTLTGIYVHEGKSWWIYRTNVKTNFDFNDAVNEILDVQVYVRELTAEDLNPVEQLTKLLFEHINNKFNPHEVTKEQVGLGNVDNTADMDKPVSRPQKEYIDALENRVKGWFKQLNVWINNHVTEVNKKFQDVWAAINKKLDKEDYENDKDNFNAHIRNYDNPHRVTAAQVGLPTAASDIEKLKQKAQELQGLLINKQDKTSEELVTDNKRIVDAINEIYGIVVEHNNHVRSNSINQIEVTSEIPTTFEDGTLWIRIPRNEEDYITIKIEAVPVDSTIRMINSEGKESAGIGSASLECLIQSRLHYIVEKENYITKDGVFGNNIAYQYGYKFGNVAVADQSKWVVSLALVNGSGSLNETTQFKVLNISGQKLFYTMDPNTAIQFNGIPYFDDIYFHDGNVWELYPKLSTAVFPEGSRCIQIQDISQDQETFNLFNYELPVESPNDSATLKTEWDRIKLNGGTPLILKDVEYFLQSNNGIAKYPDAYYRGAVKAQGVTYSLNDQIAKQKASLQSLTEALGPSDIDYPKIFEETAKQSCHYFNPPATQVIDAVIKSSS